MLALAWTALGAAPALAQSGPPASASASAGSQAIVLRPLSFFKVQDLDFGDIFQTGGAGTVRLFPDGSRTTTGGVMAVGNSQQPARFAGLGTQNQTVLISLSSNSIFITGPGQRMRVRNFDIGSTPTVILSRTPLRFRLAAGLGNFNFPLGATLDVNANQAPGDYSGTFTIILNYQ